MRIGRSPALRVRACTERAEFLPFEESVFNGSERSFRKSRPANVNLMVPLGGS